MVLIMPQKTQEKQQRPITDETPFVERVVIKGLFGKKDIDWTLGDVNVLVGQNGSGKSTILRAIYGALNPNFQLKEDFENIEKMAVVLKNDGFINVGIQVKDEDSFKALLSKELLKHLENEDVKPIKGKKEISSVIDQLVEFMDKSNEVKEIISSSTEKSYVGEADDESVNRLLQPLHIEYLCTFDMMLLTKKEQNEIDGDVFTQLDLALNKEISRLTEYQLELNNLSFNEYTDEGNAKEFITIRKANFSHFNQFEQALNTMFNPNNKQFKISAKGKVEVYYGEDQIPLTALSSGEKQLILILLRVVNTSDKPTVLLLDEPEISLHLHWQENLINIIKSINEQCQLIIVTHSPAIMMNGWMDSYVDMKDISTDSE